MWLAGVTRGRKARGCPQTSSGIEYCCQRGAGPLIPCQSIYSSGQASVIEHDGSQRQADSGRLSEWQLPFGGTRSSRHCCGMGWCVMSLS